MLRILKLWLLLLLLLLLIMILLLMLPAIPNHPFLLLAAQPPLKLLHIRGWHTPRHAALFNLDPAIARIVPNQHKPLTRSHGVFRLALCRVLIQRLGVSEFLGAALRSDRRTLFVGWWLSLVRGLDAGGGECRCRPRGCKGR